MDCNTTPLHTVRAERDAAIEDRNRLIAAIVAHRHDALVRGVMSDWDTRLWAVLEDVE